MRLIFVEQLHDQRASCRTIVTNYCCPVKLKKHLNPSPKPNIYGLRGICYQK